MGQNREIFAHFTPSPQTWGGTSANLKHLTALLEKASKGRFGREKACEIREAARRSIGTYLPAKSLELKHTINLIRELSSEIDEIETEIKKIMDSIALTVIRN